MQHEIFCWTCHLPPCFLPSRYDLVVNSVNPQKGSTTGGTRVTVTGSGFGSAASDVIVLIGDVVCDVVSVNISEIVCITGANPAGNQTLNVC